MPVKVHAMAVVGRGEEPVLGLRKQLRHAPFEPRPVDLDLAAPAAHHVPEVLCREVSRGEIDDVIASLPGEIRALFPSGAVADWRRRQPGELVTAGAS